MIIQAETPCYVPVTDDGNEFEYGEGIPHWQTEKSAAEGIAHLIENNVAEVAAKLEPYRCWHLACNACGYRFDEGEWVAHFADRGEIDAILLSDYEWTVDGERHYCMPCSEERAA